jgi:hypothetical protein
VVNEVSAQRILRLEACFDAGWSGEKQANVVRRRFAMISLLRMARNLPL